MATEVQLSSQEAAKTVHHLVILIHGIRTHAPWFRDVSAEIRKLEGFAVDGASYGWFGPIRLISPLGRSGPVRRVAQRIRDLKASNPHAKISIIAHSNGTFIASKLLETCPDLRFEYIVLVGSIVDEAFHWEKYDRQYKTLLNECGGRDIWPLMAKAWTWGYGTTGTFGFKRSFDRHWPHASHSTLLSGVHCKDHWLPLLQLGQLTKVPDSQAAPKKTFVASLRSALQNFLSTGLPKYILILGLLLWSLSPPSYVETVRVPVANAIRDGVDKPPVSGKNGFLLVPGKSRVRFVASSTRMWTVDRLLNIAKAFKTEGSYSVPADTMRRYVEVFNQFCLSDEAMFVAYLKLVEHDYQMARLGLAAWRGSDVGFGLLSEYHHREGLFKYAFDLARVIKEFSESGVVNEYTVTFGDDSVESNVKRQVWSRVEALRLLSASRPDLPSEFGPYFSTAGLTNGDFGARPDLPMKDEPFGSLIGGFVKFREVTNVLPISTNAMAELSKQVPGVFQLRFLHLQRNEDALNRLQEWWVKSQELRNQKSRAAIAISMEGDFVAFYDRESSIENRGTTEKWVRFVINDDVPEDNGEDGFAELTVSVQGTVWGLWRLRRFVHRIQSRFGLY